MGSYLSIVNNTPYEWQCRIGPDEKALKIAGIIVSAIGLIAATIVTAGAITPLTAAIGPTAVGILGVSGTVLKLVGPTSAFGVIVSKGVADSLASKGYKLIPPGDKMRSNKLTLSLWQQGTCVRSYAVDARTVRTETLYMRPIFTGATDGSNRDHDIQWWINKHGVETKDVVGMESKKKNNSSSSSESTHSSGQQDSSDDDDSYDQRKSKPETRQLEDLEPTPQVKEFHVGETDVNDLELTTGDTVVIIPQQ